ncbi:MAG: PD-(D/E)XK nuclease family protein [Candidatus Shapirobacteria bacterium]|nr:PD-(D/E)XK nuclease family protein [Candidatus Shapirobacteria bacterium]
MSDRYSATWLSHTSIGDFNHCPRAYFLKHIYRDPKTGHKIKLISPPLTLGQVVHEVIEEISVLPKNDRFLEPLMARFDRIWEKFSGRRGGFSNRQVENRYKQRGRDMIARLINYPGPLKELAVKIDMNLPYFWLSEKDNLILCGKIDWLEYLVKEKAVGIIDFKTGQGGQEEDSLQLPIYRLITENCQERPVKKASFWYLDRQNYPRETKLPPRKETLKKLLKVGQKIRLSYQMDRFSCPKGEQGCSYCLPLEAVIDGKAELVGLDEFGQDVYFLGEHQTSGKTTSKVL